MAPDDKRASCASGTVRGGVPSTELTPARAPRVFIPDPPLVYFIPSADFDTSSNFLPDFLFFSIPRLLPQRSRRLLDLFSGTGSVGAVYRAHGWQVMSLDVDPKWDATIQMDIRQWDFKQYPRDFFGAIFVAPPCTEYSTSMTARPRDLAEANSLVRAALEIVKWFEAER